MNHFRGDLAGTLMSWFKVGSVRLKTIAGVLHFRDANDTVYAPIVARTIKLTDFPGAGKVLTSDVDGNGSWQTPTGGAGGAFTNLSDVPQSYSGAGGKILAVKPDLSGIEFVTPTGGGEGGVDHFTELLDVPASYAGMAGKILRVNAAGTGLEFVSLHNMALPPLDPTAWDDEFEDADGHSGPVNGLASKWALRGGMLSSWFNVSALTGSVVIDVPSSVGTVALDMYQPAPEGDFAIEAGFTILSMGARMMFGLVAADAAGAGICFQNDPLHSTHAVGLRDLSAWGISGSTSDLTTHLLGNYMRLRLKRVGNVWTAGYTTSLTAEPDQMMFPTQWTRTFTPAYVGFGRMYTASASTCSVALDYFRVNGLPA